jgi:hypothetical protein
VVHCVFTKAGWMAGKKQREMVDLGHWQELLNSNLEDLAEPVFGSQQAGLAQLKTLIIGGRPMAIVNEDNRFVVETMVPQISHQRATRIQGLQDATPSAPSPQPEVATTAKIPCRSCGALNENTATRCSSCSAPTG